MGIRLRKPIRRIATSMESNVRLDCGEWVNGQGCYLWRKERLLCLAVRFLDSLEEVPMEAALDNAAEISIMSLRILACKYPELDPTKRKES